MPDSAMLPFSEQTKTAKFTNSSQVMRALKTRFSAPEYAFFSEVPNSTGSATRRADGLAMGLWRSRGLYLTGFEVKVSRSDWLNELKKPQKADVIAKFCDFWYVVVGDETIVKDGELPLNWGLMVPFKNGLRIKKEAPRLEAEPMTRAFIAALFRKASETLVDEREINEAVAKARDESYKLGYAYGFKKGSIDAPRLQARNEQLTEIIKNFEEASGINLFENAWDKSRPAKIGEAVKFLLSGGADSLLNDLESIETKARRILETIEKLKEIKI